MKESDVIIIGAGIAGLSLGALLAKDEIKVTLLERSNKIGGRAQIWENQGYLVDNGIHGFRRGRYGEVAKVAKKLGIKSKLKFMHRRDQNCPERCARAAGSSSVT